MEKPEPTREELCETIRNLEDRLVELEQTLHAIRSGEVDALVVSEPDGDQIYTLKGSNYGYRVLVESMSEGALILAPNDSIYYCNGTLGKMLGLPIEKIISGKLDSHVASQDRTRLMELIEKSRGFGAARGELRMKRKDASSLPVNISLHGLTVGDFEGLCAVITDLTQQKHVEEELRRHRTELEKMVEERTNDLALTNTRLLAAKVEAELRAAELEEGKRILDAIMEYIPEGITIASAPDVITTHTSQYAQDLLADGWNSSTGLSMEDWLARVEPLLPDGTTRARVEDLPLWKAVKLGETVKGQELAVRNAAGNLMPVLCNAGPIKGKNGQIIGGVLAWSDITERKQAENQRIGLEQQLQQAQKAESLGRMAGAIAHHFNNMLGAVIGNLELALDDLPQGSEARESIVESMKASRRAAEISRLMLAYQGQTLGHKEPLDLVEVVRETLPLLDASIPPKVALKIDFPPQGPVVLGDVVHIKQVLTNLLSNAAEVTAQNEGSVTVAVQVKAAADIQGMRFFPLDWQPKAAVYACLSVADTGRGMDSATLERIFDPFFSTKFTGRGLGLPVVLGLVRAHDGAISVESRPDRGTLFQVFFPLHAQTLTPAKEPSTVIKQEGQAGLILVVDDEAMVRNMAESMLKRKFGYEVVTAGDGYEALEVFSARKDEISLVLLDVSMPGMNGWQTLSALRALQPDIPVILASGYDEAQVMREDCPERPQAFLHKPYDASDLKSALVAAKRA